MDVYEAVRTVLAVRAYKDTPIPRDVVERIVDAARLTGSASNRQPWHFIVVEEPDQLRRLGALAKSGPYIAQAPLAVVVVIENTKFAVSDASRAVQSMVLTAWAEGIGSNWVGWIDGLAQIKPLFGIPDELEVLTVIPFGYPVQAVGQGKKNRKPRNEVVHREQFGAPFWR